MSVSTYRPIRFLLPLLGLLASPAHRFQLGPPLANGIVHRFEEEHGVTLPEDYRAFITVLGHGGPGRWGGAGPYYGLHPLQDWAIALRGMPTATSFATPFPVEPVRIYQDWLAEVIPGDGEAFTGTLALSDQGCGDLSILVISGPARGRIADTCYSSTGPNFTNDADFLGWYERWLDAVLAGATSFR